MKNHYRVIEHAKPNGQIVFHVVSTRYGHMAEHLDIVTAEAAARLMNKRQTTPVKSWTASFLSYCGLSSSIFAAMECINQNWMFPFIILALGLSAYFCFTDGDLF